LYYRIQGLTLTLPPLRERADRKALIQFLLKQELPDDASVTIDDELMAALEQHRWPGNIRQLRNVLRTMVVLRNNDVLTRECLPADFFGNKNVAGAVIPPPEPHTLRNPLESAEREALIQELKLAGWNLSKVAKQLKLSRNTLYRKLDRLGIETASRNDY
jgi:sigma-54 dependent transcriptional regulator, acetoin dehydrogenase operon transcriptional activator AcoR